MEYIWLLETRGSQKHLFPSLHRPVGMWIRPPTEKERKQDWENILETSLRSRSPLRASPGDALCLANHGV